MPTDNPTRLSKTKNRSIRLKLPVDLLDAIREMGLDATCRGVGVSRSLKNMIECSLMWAVWAHSHGRGPDAEIGSLEHGYNECDLVVRARRDRREVEYLERLFRLSGRG
jgi:hypothetical protein